MGIEQVPPDHSVVPDDADTSVAGEEDPGAALDTENAGPDDTAASPQRRRPPAV
jgi:hypothetical protein